MVVLGTAGYRRQTSDASTDWNFLMVDGIGRQLDIHVFRFDTSGRNVYGIEYPRESLQIRGLIDRQVVLGDHG